VVRASSGLLVGGLRVRRSASVDTRTGRVQWRGLTGFSSGRGIRGKPVRVAARAGGRRARRQAPDRGLLLAPDHAGGEDGILRLGEIYNLDLRAELVVLGACETGLGRLAGGEGVIGLTRAFLYAGATSVLVSLWPVSDESTSDLMVAFYDELLGGRPSAEALRQTKLRLLGRHLEYAKPYYWSAFVLIGG
jgi:hypothetical protein